MTDKKRRNKIIICAAVLIVYFCFAFYLVYNAEIFPHFEENIKITLMNKHKDNSVMGMNGVEPYYYQDFTGTPDDIKKIRIRCKRKGSDDDAYIYFRLLDADTGEEYAVTDGYVNDLIKTSYTFVTINVPEKNRNLKGKNLRLFVELQDAVLTRVYLTSNYKQGLVYNVNNYPDLRFNIIYNMEFGQKAWLNKLYFAVMALLILFLVLSFYLFIIKKYEVAKAYIPIAVILGITMSAVFMPHGIPDEPGHIDTAYQLSNIMMGKGKAGDGIVYKRKADVIQDDLLVNGLESNSYYQLKENLFKRPSDTELIPVVFDDAGRIVPDIVYLPMAVGITIGRLLGLSTLMTYYIGRMLNLLVFILITAFAIKLLPYGKNLVAMIMLLPISMQQASSASYDSMINALLILYMAYNLMLYYNKKFRIKDAVVLLLLSGFIVMCKGGVYAPLCLLLIGLPYSSFRLSDKKEAKEKPKKLIFIISILAVAAVLISVLIYAGYPTFKTLLVDGTIRGETEIYTFSDIMNDPETVLYMVWNTMVQRGGSLLAGLLGGRLSWLDVKGSWIFLIILGSGLLFMTNIEGDKLTVSTKEKSCIMISHVFVIILIVGSMIVGFTKLDSDVIQGLQGRYFLPVMPLLLLMINTDMINIKKEKLYKLAMVMMVAEAMIILESLPQVID